MASIEKRRAIRALEAKRDKLLIANSKNKIALTMVRAELKEARKK